MGRTDMTTDQAVARQAARDNLLSMPHLSQDTLARIRDVLTRMTNIEVNDYRALGVLMADASFAHICLRVDLGEWMPQ